MLDPHFEYLTGTVEVPAVAPESWVEDGLGDFYRAPNDEQWGASLCRVLYHESIHFWQLLASGYVANLVADDWQRLLHFEKTGKVGPVSADGRRYGVRAKGRPFSARELVECWARHWDIHTRGPHAIVADEEIDVSGVGQLEMVDPYTGQRSYTHVGFDLLMRRGRGEKLYGRPYRWMLNEADGHSAFVAITFPILTHAAFGSPDPVRVFRAAFERAWSSPLLREAVDGRSGSVNLDWLNNWSAVLGEAHYPVLRERSMPDYTSGFDVINRGVLGSHPIYREYLARVPTLEGHLNLLKQSHAQGPVPDDSAELESYATAGMPSRDRWVVFGLPGQPTYRYLLGRALPPPQVRFENATVVARRPVIQRLFEQEAGEPSDDTFEPRLKELERRVDKFRRAEAAVRRGLPPNAFDPPV